MGCAIGAAVVIGLLIFWYVIHSTDTVGHVPLIKILRLRPKSRKGKNKLKSDERGGQEVNEKLVAKIEATTRIDVEKNN